MATQQPLLCLNNSDSCNKQAARHSAAGARTLRALSSQPPEAGVYAPPPPREGEAASPATCAPRLLSAGAAATVACCCCRASMRSERCASMSHESWRAGPAPGGDSNNWLVTSCGAAARSGLAPAAAALALSSWAWLAGAAPGARSANFLAVAGVLWGTAGSCSSELQASTASILLKPAYRLAWRWVRSLRDARNAEQARRLFVLLVGAPRRARLAACISREAPFLSPHVPSHRQSDHQLPWGAGSSGVPARQSPCRSRFETGPWRAMGNAVGTPSRLAASEAVSDLQGVTFKDSLGERQAAAAGSRRRPGKLTAWPQPTA